MADTFGFGLSYAEDFAMSKPTVQKRLWDYRDHPLYAELGTEGVRLKECDQCGAVIMQRDCKDIDYIRIHEEWHERIGK